MLQRFFGFYFSEKLTRNPAVAEIADRTVCSTMTSD